MGCFSEEWELFGDKRGSPEIEKAGKRAYSECSGFFLYVVKIADGFDVNYGIGILGKDIIFERSREGLCHPR